MRRAQVQLGQLLSVGSADRNGISKVRSESRGTAKFGNRLKPDRWMLHKSQRPE